MNSRAFPLGAPLAIFLAFLLSCYALFHSQGADWYVTTGQWALVQGGATPSAFGQEFSYFYGGGTYLLGDPQTMALSPSALLLIKLGSALQLSAAWMLRLWFALISSLGALGFAIWIARAMRTHATTPDEPDTIQYAASLSAFAWVTSLGFFWRVAAGHGQFCLFALAPWLLICLENIFAQPSKKNAAIFSMAMAFAIWEPAFHPLFVLVLPALAVRFVLLLVRKPQVQLLRSLASVGIAAILTLFMTAPRWGTWMRLPMGRGIDFNDGTISLRDAIYASFATARTTNLGMRVYPWSDVRLSPGSGGAIVKWQNLWEINTALAPIASLLALVGIYIFFKSARKEGNTRSLGLFAMVLVVAGIAISSQAGLWHLIQSVTSPGLRAPVRFLNLTNFGLATLAAFGFLKMCEWLKSKWPSYFSPRMLFLILLTSIALFQFNWITRAQKIGTLSRELISAHEDSPQATAAIAYPIYCSVGSGCFNNFDNGYDTDPFQKFLKRESLSILPIDSPILQGIEVQHQQLRISSLKAGVPKVLPFRQALLGQSVTSSDPAATVTLSATDGPMQIRSDRDLEWVKIQPLPLIPRWSYFAALFGLLGTVALLIPYRRHHGQR